MPQICLNFPICSGNLFERCSWYIIPKFAKSKKNIMYPAYKIVYKWLKYTCPGGWDGWVGVTMIIRLISVRNWTGTELANWNWAWQYLDHVTSQVRYSGEMEPYCAKTILLQLTHELGLQIDSLTTDRSTTMRTMIRTLSPELPANHPPITHYFDIWHLIKVKCFQ